MILKCSGKTNSGQGQKRPMQVDDLRKVLAEKKAKKDE